MTGVQTCALPISALTGADFTAAILRGTNLIDVDLSRATLVDTDLTGARIENTKLIDADLSGALLEKAIIRGTELVGANMSTVRRLGFAVLEQNQHSGSTQWPDAFDPGPSEAVPQESIAAMDLATYLAHRMEASRVREEES